MKINVLALFETSAIRCVHMSEHDGVVQRNSARVAFITETTVAASRALSVDDAKYRVKDGDPDVNYGSLVAVIRDADGIAHAKLFGPGVGASLYLDCDGEEIGITGEDMLKLREKVVAMSSRDVQLSDNHRRALSGIQEIFEMVSSAPNTDRFSANLIAQSYHASMIDSFGEVRLPVSDEEFSRKGRADLIRAKIGLLDPLHQDAIGNARPLRSILSDAGCEITLSGVSAEIRSAAARHINEEAIRRTILANDRMCREVFGAMTSTPIENLSAAMISTDGLEKLRQVKSNRRLSGDWIDQVHSRAKEIAQAGMPNYKFEMDVFSEDGRDYLTISDNVGMKNNAAFVYSWPSSERIAAMEIAEGRIINISPEEIPSEDDIQRLSEVLLQLSAAAHDARHENDRAQFVQ